MWLLLSILTVICWGVSIATLKRSYQTLTPVMWIIMGSIAGLVILLPYALLNHPQFIFWPLIPVSIVASGCYAFLSYALDKGKVSLVATVFSIYPLITVILASIFLHEVTSIFVKMGVVVIILGLMFLSVEDPKNIRSIKIGSWFLWGLTAAFATGLADFLSKTMVSLFDPYTYLVGFVIGELVIAVVASALDRANIKPVSLGRDTIYMVISAATLYFGYLFFFLAFSQGLASLVTPISGTFAIVTFFLAITWLKEKVNKFQILGAILTICGAVIVSSL